ncbi:MAG: CCA tRNA nucleotidyltransferase [Pseudomonadota bacterium]
MTAAASLVALSPEQRCHFAWLDAPHLKKVISALDKAEADASRFVGGCVRDSLFGEAPKDFDVATLLTPDAVIKALQAAGLAAAPTGIDHGTVTAIADHQGVEVTTLRADVATDGRRAVVAFTRDWAEDAGRRDFRLNAIYLTPDGHLFDPVAGLDDIAARRIRFIGDPDQRIREDYLRILRFFRFTARFSDNLDADGLGACDRLKTGIDVLSAERIGAEMMAILSLPRAGAALRAMRDIGVLDHIWDAPADIDSIERLKKIAPDAAAPVALAILFGEAGGGIGARLRLSNAEKSIRSNALKGADAIVPDLSEPQARVLIYRLGKDVFQDATAVAAAQGEISQSDYDRLISLVDQWTPPVLPVSGRHIVDRGIKQGPAVAHILARVERQWIDEGFPDELRVREILELQVKAH